MTRSFDVVGGGAAAVDHLLFVDAGIGDGKGRIVRREVRFGGNVATALIAAARTGASCAFIGHLPAAGFDDGLLDNLRAEEVNIEYARTTPGTQPIQSTVLVGHNGQRFIAYDDETVVGLPDDLDLELVKEARVLVLDEYGLAGGIRAATAARAAGRPVLADIERGTDPLVSGLLDVANHLVLPRQFALAWTGTEREADAVEAFWREDRAAVVVTCGADGCWYRAADEPTSGVLHHPALMVDAVDTTGCGDVFHGSYAAALADGNSVARCIDEAAAAAAECATHPGGIGPRQSQRGT